MPQSFPVSFESPPQDTLVARVATWIAAQALADAAVGACDWAKQERLDRWLSAEAERICTARAQTCGDVLAKIDLAAAMLSPVDRREISWIAIESAWADLATLAHGHR